ncbi:MAG: ammonium transporter, partial [Ignavibacteriae bacterium]|nr:ammonium transporter [Ignavibacteriota bacterium]
MKNNKIISKIVLTTIFSLCSAVNLFAQKIESTDLTSILHVQQYDRAIHIMAMLLIGFGFLMVFIRKYGRSALTATFLLVSISLPIYMALKTLGIFEARGEIEQLILAEFSGASLLIAA